MTNMRNNNRKWDIPLYHQGGPDKPRLELSAKDEGWWFAWQRVQQMKVCWYLQRKSCFSGNISKAKDKGQGEWTGLNRRLPPTSQRGVRKTWRRVMMMRDGSNPGHKGHKNKYHIVIRVIRWKECGGQPELGQKEKAGDGWVGRHPDIKNSPTGLRRYQAIPPQSTTLTYHHPIPLSPYPSGGALSSFPHPTFPYTPLTYIPLLDSCLVEWF